MSQAAIQAAWPHWWTDEADASPSGRAELRFSLARRLGLAPQPLLGERVEFVWNDEAKFKHLAIGDDADKAVISSFGISVGRLLLRAMPRARPLKTSPLELRRAILSQNTYVDLAALIATSWALHIPVIHLRVFPLEAKRMHAMVVRVDDRFAILLGRDSLYPAPIAFTLAHELGHVMLDHLDDAPALVDVEDPAHIRSEDSQEKAADRFALELLTGSAKPDIQASLDHFNAPTLAKAVIDASTQYGIEPGTLALCLAYQNSIWPVAMSSLKFIYGKQKPAWQEVNAIADRELHWDELSDEAANYLQRIMTGSDA